MRGSGGISGGGRPSRTSWKAWRRLPLRGRPRDCRAGGRERLQRLDRYLVALVVTHFAVTLVHAGSHFALQILPTGLDLVFILSVITIGPIVGLLVLRFNRILAAALLAVLLAASFVYGFHSHFLSPGPDKVTLVISESWTIVFVVTAPMIGALEIAGVVVAAAVFWAAARIPSEPAGPPA